MALMDQQRVLVVDSGVGGLSICEEIIARLPSLEILYVSDNAAFPYGNKSHQQVVCSVTDTIASALTKFTVDAIVIACNTASTAALASLRERWDMPIVGVVPAIKTAAETSRNSTFGLLATPGTVASAYTASLISDFANHCRVIRVASAELVTLVEEHLYGQPLSDLHIEQILCQFERQPHGDSIDTVVLGCTHFPLIRDRLQVLRPQWRWLDSGPAIANRLAQQLTRKPVTTGGQQNDRLREPRVDCDTDCDCDGQNQFFHTAERASDASFTRYLARLGFAPPALLRI